MICIARKESLKNICIYFLNIRKIAKKDHSNRIVRMRSLVGFASALKAYLSGDVNNVRLKLYIIQLFHAFAGNIPRCYGRTDVLSPEAARPVVIVDRVVHSTEGDRNGCCL